MRLHHIAVNCADFERSLRFYSDGLGRGGAYLWNAPPMVSQAAFIALAGSSWIELFAGGESEGARGQRAAGLTHFALAVDDVQAAFDRLVSAGGVPAEPPVTRTLHGDPPLEATMAFVVGPDGEVIELYRNDGLS